MEAVANLKAVWRTRHCRHRTLYLASDDAHYISSYNLLLDGGFSIVNPSFGIFKDRSMFVIACLLEICSFFPRMRVFH
jgi:hypothetical protein